MQLNPIIGKTPKWAKNIKFRSSCAKSQRKNIAIFVINACVFGNIQAFACV